MFGKIKKTVILFLFALTCCMFSAEEVSANAYDTVGSSYPIGITLSVTWDPANSLNHLEWSELVVDTDVPTAYRVYRKFGYMNRIPEQRYINHPNDLEGWTLLGKYWDVTSASDSPPRGYGTWSYVVFAFNQIGPPQRARSNIDVSMFVHSLTRRDGEGEQWQFDQEWNIGYQLQSNAFTNITIFSSNTVVDDFYPTNDYGMYITTGSNPARPPQVIYQMSEDAVRSFEMSDGSWREFMLWYCTDENGKLVPRGIYLALVETWVPHIGEFPGYGDDELALRGSALISIPVRGITITDVNTSGIKSAGELAEIHYKTNAVAKTKIIITKPMTQFKKATSTGTLTFLDTETYDYVVGDPLPLEAGSTHTVDAGRILSYKTQINNAGENTFLWDGRTDRGVSAGLGMFRVAISAIDSFGYHSYDTEGMITRSIPVDERIADIEVDRDPPVLESIRPSDGSIIRHSLDSISVTLSDATGVDDAVTSIEIEGPDPEDPEKSLILYTAPDDMTIEPTGDKRNRIYNIIFNTPITLNGRYDIRIETGDLTDHGNPVTYVTSFRLEISEDESSFTSSLRVFPQPADTGSVQFEYRTMAAADITIEVFNLMQQQQYKEEFFMPAAGPRHRRTWDLTDNSGRKLPPGVYFYRVTVDYTADGGDKFSAIRKMAIIE